MATRSINQQAHREMKLKAEALLPLFNKEFPDEKTTLERIFIASGTKKCECGAELIPDFESRSFECGKCGEDTWLTAKTGFRNVRQLRVYVAAAWFQDRGVKLSGPQLASLMGAPTATCQRAAKRPGVTILEVVKKAPEQVLVSTAEFCSTYARRSTETPEGEHPVAEQKAMERKCGISHKSDPSDESSDESNRQNSDNLVPCESSLSQQILELLANSPRPLHFQEILNKIDDSLDRVTAMTSAVMSLWFSGRIVPLFGDNWKLAPAKVIPELECSDFILNVLDEFCYQVQLFKGGISRKHVQVHLALYCFHKVRSLLTPDWLFEAMCQSRPLLLEPIPDVSPLMINLFGFLNLHQTSLITLPVFSSPAASAPNLNVAPT